MTINVRPQQPAGWRHAAATGALLLTLWLSSDVYAQCSRGGGGRGQMPPTGGGPAPTGGGALATGASLGQLQQVAAMAQQARLVRFQRQQMAVGRQQQASLHQQRAFLRPLATRSVRPPRSNRYLESAQARRAAYLRMHDQSDEAPEPLMVAHNVPSIE